MLRRFKNAIAQLMRKCGYEIIPSYQLSQMPLAYHLQELFARLEIDLVVDVGAHYGEYARFLRDIVGYKGKIVSVEPIGDNFRILTGAREADSEWMGVNIALGPANASMPINVTKDTQFASFRIPSQAGLMATGNAEMYSNATVQRIEEVEVCRLDDLLEKQCAGKRSARIYLKLDTQGFDLQVLSGIGAWRSSVLAMQSEISMLPLYVEMPTSVESIEAFNNLGFDVTGFFPVSRDEKLRVIEFDCTLISKNAL